MRQRIDASGRRPSGRLGRRLGVRLTTWGGLSVLLAVLLPGLLSAQTAPDNASILQRLDRLERENRAMAEEIRELRAQLSGEHPAPPAGTAPAADTATAAAPEPGETLAEKVDIQGQRIEEQAQTKVEASQRFPITLTGMVLVNAFVNSRQNGGSDYATAASFAPGADRAGGTVRQSIIGLEYHGPRTFWGATLHGALFMDFFQGAAPLSQWLRVRTATIQADWKTRSVKIGVDKPIFNPRDPDSLAQVGISPLTGTGNLWLWMPQIRFEQDFALGSTTGVNAQLGAVETHEVNPYLATASPVKIEATRPGLEGRAMAWHKFDENRRVELAAGFHASTTHAGGFSIPSNLVSLDWFVNPWRRVEFSGVFFSGKNLSNLGTGAINQGYYLAYNAAEAIKTMGGWGQITLHTFRRLDFHLFTGQQHYQLYDRPGTATRNLLFGGNLFFRVAPNVLFGPEITQTRTLYLGQGLRINNHYDMALAYLF